jgi:hypothetical protein
VGAPPPLDTPIVGQLSAVAQRLAKVSGEPFPWNGSVFSGSAASQQQLAERLESLIGCLETCADGVGVSRLDGLTARLEVCAALPTPCANASGGAMPKEKTLAQLEAVVARLEAVVA